MQDAASTVCSLQIAPSSSCARFGGIPENDSTSTSKEAPERVKLFLHEEDRGANNAGTKDGWRRCRAHAPLGSNRVQWGTTSSNGSSKANRLKCSAGGAVGRTLWRSEATAPERRDM